MRLIFILLCLGFCLGCGSIERLKGEPWSCFMHRACLDANKKNHDKSSCAAYANPCAKIAEKIDEANIKCQSTK